MKAAIYDLLWEQRAQGSMRLHKRALEWSTTHLPPILSENPFNLKGHDKVFTSIWLDSTQVLIGTKENKLLVLELAERNQFRSVPLIDTQQLLTLIKESTFKNFTRKLDPSLLFRDPLTPTQQQSTTSRRFGSSSCQGIRSLSINPSQTLLAVGMANPAVVMIYRLPDLSPYAITNNDHHDAVFSVQWIDDDRFLTGSRDGSLSMWRVEGYLRQFSRTWTSGQCFSERVRDMKLLKGHNSTAASLTSSGALQIWDVNRLEKVKTVDLPYTKELVCLSTQEHVIAVGSQSHITLVDRRERNAVQTAIASLDGDWGVRSLEFNGHTLVCGGGQGRISFYDTRNKAYLVMHDETQFKVTTGGWLDEDNSIYQTYFTGQPRLSHAVYTTAFSPDRTKLFAAGGPIQAGLKGCYAAVWS